ncbi:DUF6286 domain-containing protein [Actinophytocola glycyrrhizae]|uniref:DUF6286 domain-containing protein n=1 Tax=Actinophytocola glycyrrhizae TaxID=2044873 RepID=A0ABV9S583_9PSEU
MKRRPRRGIAATVVALVLCAAGVLAAVVAIQSLLGERPWVSYDWAARTLYDTRWQDTAVLIAGIVVAVLGLLVLTAALLPGKPTVLPLRDDDSELDTGASRRGLLGTLRAAAASVDGVSSARLRLGRRRVRAAVRTHRVTTAGLGDAVTSAVTHRLAQIGPATDLTVHTRTSTTRKAR